MKYDKSLRRICLEMALSTDRNPNRLMKQILRQADQFYDYIEAERTELQEEKQEV